MTQDINPYKPPQADLALDTPTLAGGEASKGRRLGTFVVDYIGFVVFGGLTGGLLGFFLGPEGLQSLEKIPDLVFGSLVVAAYYLFFEGIWARTPGKWAFGTIVVDESGKPPSFGQIAGRTACRWIPFEAFSFLGERGWHDRFSKTRVLRYAKPAA